MRALWFVRYLQWKGNYNRRKPPIAQSIAPITENHIMPCPFCLIRLSNRKYSLTSSDLSTYSCHLSIPISLLSFAHINLPYLRCHMPLMDQWLFQPINLLGFQQRHSLQQQACPQLERKREAKKSYSPNHYYNHSWKEKDKKKHDKSLSKFHQEPPSKSKSPSGHTLHSTSQRLSSIKCFKCLGMGILLWLAQPRGLWS